MHHNEDGRALALLIHGKIGDQRYGVFFATGEGRFMPNGIEESSGHVVTGDGHHYFYWTGWNERFNGMQLAVWTPIDDAAEIEQWDDAEYREARRAAGLTDY